LWTQLGGHLSDCSDPIIAYFSEKGFIDNFIIEVYSSSLSDLLEEPTFLCPNHYSPRFLASSDFQSQALPHRPIYMYHNDKQIWSITPLPENSQGVSAYE
jgi:hypothetical protein